MIGENSTQCVQAVFVLQGWKNIRCKCAQVIVTCRLNVLNGNKAPDCSKAISKGFLNVKHGSKLHLCTWHFRKKHIVQLQ